MQYVAALWQCNEGSILFSLLALPSFRLLVTIDASYSYSMPQENDVTTAGSGTTISRFSPSPTDPPTAV